jgi:hypothetical protein
MATVDIHTFFGFQSQDVALLVVCISMTLLATFVFQRQRVCLVDAKSQSQSPPPPNGTVLGTDPNKDREPGGECSVTPFPHDLV